MTAHIMKEKTSRGLSSLEESVKVALKYICEREAHGGFFLHIKESAEGATVLLIMIYRVVCLIS